MTTKTTTQTSPEKPSKIGVEEALNLLREVVEGREEYVYQPYEIEINGAVEKVYQYTHGDEPGCIIGHVMAKATPELYDLFHELETEKPSSSGIFQIREVNEFSPASLVERFNGISAHFTPEAVVVLREAQRKQDYLKPWGEALKAAEELAADPELVYYK